MKFKEKYNAALSRARKLHSETEFDYEKGMIEEIFPELKENESERIRKVLIDYFQAYNPNDTHVYQPYCFVRTLESDIPCWSLDALFGVIPKRIKDYNVLRIDISDNAFAIWYDEIGYGVNNDLPNITAESAVDACYEMIIKLNELDAL